MISLKLALAVHLFKMLLQCFLCKVVHDFISTELSSIRTFATEHAATTFPYGSTIRFAIYTSILSQPSPPRLIRFSRLVWFCCNPEIDQQYSPLRRDLLRELRGSFAAFAKHNFGAQQRTPPASLRSTGEIGACDGKRGKGCQRRGSLMQLASITVAKCSHHSSEVQFLESRVGSTDWKRSL